MALDPNNFIDDIKKGVKDALKDAFKGGSALGTSFGYDFSKSLGDAIKESRKDIRDAFKQAEADSKLLSLMKTTGLRGEFAEYARLLEQQTGPLSKAMIERLLLQQRELDHINEHNELTRELAKWQLELNEEVEEYSKSWEKIKSKIKAVLTDPQVAKAVFLTSMAEKSHEVYESFEQLNKSGLAVGQRIDYMAKGFSLMSVMGLSDTKGVLNEMKETMGTLGSLTSSEVDHVGHLAVAMGVTGEEAFQLVENFSKLPGETMKTAAHAADYVKNLSKANGVAPGKITKEIAKNTELIALGGYKGAKAFTEAAMKAQKMGVELSTTATVMKGLLNYEESINKQMEASVLLGKQINLDRARQLALEGKSVEATEEILKNIGGQAAFDKMNVLQKEALASATGMTVEQMQKMIDAQVEYNKYHGEDVSMWKSGLGYAMEWGGGVVGFMKENGIAILASIQLMQTLNLKKMFGFLAEKAHFAWSKVASLWRTQDEAKQLSFAAKREMVAKRQAALEKMNAGGGIKSAGSAAAGAVGPMLAFGGAVLMIGVGIGIATLGMAQLVEAFGKTTNAGYALAAIITVMAGFALMVNILATASLTAAPGLYVLGGAVLMIGVGVGIAAAGMALFVNSIANLANKEVVNNLYGVGGGLYYIAGALGAVAAGSLAIPALITIKALGLSDTNEQEPQTKESQFAVLQKGVDELNKTMSEIKDLMKKGGDVYMDTSKVGEALTKGLYYGRLARVTG